MKLLLANGSVSMTRKELNGLLEYSTTLPTGTTPGKQWRCRRPYWAPKSADNWWRGTYGRPYPEGHKHHGSIPIIWQRIVVVGREPTWPWGVHVPLPFYNQVPA